jgi:hypothetical protein
MELCQTSFFLLVIVTHSAVAINPNLFLYMQHVAGQATRGAGGDN